MSKNSLLKRLGIVAFMVLALSLIAIRGDYFPSLQNSSHIPLLAWWPEDREDGHGYHDDGYRDYYNDRYYDKYGKYPDSYDEPLDEPFFGPEDYNDDGYYSPRYYRRGR